MLFLPLDTRLVVARSLPANAELGGNSIFAMQVVMAESDGCSFMYLRIESSSGLEAFSPALDTLGDQEEEPKFLPELPRNIDLGLTFQSRDNPFQAFDDPEYEDELHLDQDTSDEPEDELHLDQDTSDEPEDELHLDQDTSDEPEDELDPALEVIDIDDEPELSMIYVATFGTVDHDRAELVFFAQSGYRINVIGEDLSLVIDTITDDGILFTVTSTDPELKFFLWHPNKQKPEELFLEEG